MDAALAAQTPVPATFLGRVRNAVRAAHGLNKDPNRLDLVLVLGESVNRRAFPRLWELFEKDPAGARVLAERPAIDSAHVDLDALSLLPDGTLGREYARFLRGNGLTLDVFKAPIGVDPRAAYLVQRIRQTHDVWHVVTGYTPDVPGEVLLQAFTFSQLKTPSSLMIAVIGTLRIVLRGRLSFFPRLVDAFKRGARAKKMAPTYWEEHWIDSVESLRATLACPAAA
jgi:ubiquinone biosynthesis protein COQ4